MKNFTLIIFCLFCLILSDSCKKKGNDIIEPLQPLPYLPVYPGSYWKYVHGEHTWISRTSDNYELFQGQYLTRLDFYYIKGYLSWRDFGQNQTAWFRLVSETVGDFWTNTSISVYPFYEQTYQSFQVMQKTVDKQGDSIIIQRYYFNNSKDQAYCYQTYKKNVGLVNEFTVNAATNDTSYGPVLVEYHINH